MGIRRYLIKPSWYKIQSFMDKNKHDFDWNETITKSVYTSDNIFVGHVDGLSEAGFIVKDKILHARYYSIPRDLLDTYEHRKVKLKISEEELNSKFRRDRPGYLESSV